MNIKKELKQWKIKSPTLDDIHTTFELCKGYLNKNEKYEFSKIKQIFRIIYSSQKKWFIEELILSILSFSLCQMTIEEYRIYFLSFISILLAALMMLQCFRNLHCNVWELENSCMITTKKVLVYKMMIMASMNLALLFFFSLYTTILTPYDFMTVFSYGAFPFFLTCAFILDLSERFKNNTTFLIGFMGANILSYIVSSTLIEFPQKHYEILALIISTIYGIAMTKRYIKTMEREGGGLLWN